MYGLEPLQSSQQNTKSTLPSTLTLRGSGLPGKLTRSRLKWCNDLRKVIGVVP